MAIGINKTTDAGAAYLAMLGKEDPIPEQMAGIDYEALRQQYSIDDLVSYFVSNKDSLSRHDPKVASAVDAYNENMIPIDKMRGTESAYLGHQMALKLLQRLGYRGESGKTDFFGVPTIDARDPYWDEFGKKGKK